jgi:hypothetical protein
MTTTINNNSRVFMLRGMGWNTQNYFCNMEDIVKCAGEFEKNQPYSIFHFWNGKQTKLSVKMVIAMLEANRLDSSFFKSKSIVQPA